MILSLLFQAKEILSKGALFMYDRLRKSLKFWKTTLAYYSNEWHTKNKVL